MKSNFSTQYRILLFIVLTFVTFPIIAQTQTKTPLKKTEDTNNYKRKVNDWNDIAFKYFNFNRDSAKIVLDLAFEMAEENNYIYGIARTLIGYGYYEITQDNYPACINYLDKAMSYYDRIEKKKLYGSCYNAYGIAYMAVSDFDKALEYYQKAYENMIEQGRDASAILGNMAVIHNKQFNYQRGLEYFYKGLEGANKAENPYLILRFQNSIATTHAELKEYSKAISMYKKVIPAALKLGMKEPAALAYGNMGKAFQYLNQPDSAKPKLEISVRMLEEINKPLLLVNNLNMLAEIYAEQKDFKKALSLLRKSEKLANELKSIDLISDVYESYAVYYKEKGELNKALNYQVKYADTRDSIYSKQQKEAIAQLETKFDFRQQQKEIELLNTKNELQQAETSKQKLYVNLSIGGMIAFLLIIVFLFLKYKKTRSTNKRLTQINLELLKVEEKNKVLKQSNSKYAAAHKDDLLEKIENLMETDKIYVQPKLTIDDFASKLNTNRSYLSQIINKHYETNFNSFINSYRIGEARRLLVYPVYKNYTIEAIAMEVGFTSKSVFNETFKKESGITPSVFKRNIK